MKNLPLLFLLLCTAFTANAQKKATIKETKKVFTTYDFSDPDPIARVGKVYPYYRFDGYTDKPAQKEWKIVELENDYIKVMILPEIGGKIWAAWEKSTGKPFIYYNQVVKFRDVAMRGPWTSGGIEANYGIIGHTPNCATPMDYLTETKADGSVSCYIGTLDLLTQTYWTIEINLPQDKAYFTTRSFWSNATPIEQPYYTWMNVGMKAEDNLEFVYPGNRYIGHGGEYSDWEINPDNGKDISFYENNDFGGPKSYHVFGKYTDFFGAYYHEEDFGMARYSLHDEKPGKKIWIWGLSRQGMIWEDLLTDNDGQYVEVQSGRLFNQAADESNRTPFKQLGFSPHTSDEWTEYWFPVKGTKGFVKANPYGALNLRFDKTSVQIDFMPLQHLSEELTVKESERVVYSRKIDLAPLVAFSDSFSFSGNIDNLTVTIGETKLKYKTDPKDGLLSRPVDTPENFDWNSAFGLYTEGKEFLQQRYYPRAEEKFQAALDKNPNYVPALADLAMLAFRNLEYKRSLQYATRALSIDTYDPAANFYYGMANRALGKVTDAKDGFDIASLSPAWRGASYTELSYIYLEEKDLDKALHYAQKSLELNAGNAASWQTVALVSRLQNQKGKAEEALAKLRTLSPLNHFIRFEKYRWENSDANRSAFTAAIQNEMKSETYLQLADWYSNAGQPEESLEVLKLAPATPDIYYRIAFLLDKSKKGAGDEFIEKGNKISPALVFPFRATTAETLEWVIRNTQDWKPKYYLALIYWSRNNQDRTKELLASCGEPSFAPFYAVRATLHDDENYVNDLNKAVQLDPGQWRFGKMLADHYLERKKTAEALRVARDYHKRFPSDFRISMLLARALLLNGEYKATTDLLAKTTILPYEGATDGRRMYHQAWMMQAVEHLESKNYKAALNAINKAKLWPENLGAGKPYDANIDLRLENYVEGLVYERTGQKEKAAAKFNEVINSNQGRWNQAMNLVTALAYRKTRRPDEGEQLLKEWTERQPENKMAAWAYAAYRGNAQVNDIEGNDTFKIIRLLPGL